MGYPIGDVSFVEIFNGEDDGGEVKLRLGPAQQAELSNCVVQLSAGHELREEVKKLLISERPD